jgi:hypothetical protein
MIEWRWSLQPMTARDQHAANLANVLDFSQHGKPLTLAPFDPGPPKQCTNSDVKERFAHGGP